MKATCLYATLFATAISIPLIAAAAGQLPADPPDKTTVIVRSAGTAYAPSGPAPAFAEMDHDGNASISPQEARGYKLLANDFIKADSNEDGQVSRAEYERWAAQP